MGSSPSVFNHTNKLEDHIIIKANEIISFKRIKSSPNLIDLSTTSTLDDIPKNKKIKFIKSKEILLTQDVCKQGLDMLTPTCCLDIEGIIILYF
jgi:hypothetical protein